VNLGFGQFIIILLLGLLLFGDLPKVIKNFTTSLQTIKKTFNEKEEDHKK
jgi:Sec-independent protein translocase protein TatA